MQILGDRNDAQQHYTGRDDGHRKHRVMKQKRDYEERNSQKRHDPGNGRTISSKWPVSIFSKQEVVFNSIEKLQRNPRVGTTHFLRNRRS